MVLNTKVKCAVQGNTDYKVEKLNHFSSNHEFVSNPLNPLSCELKIKIAQGWEKFDHELHVHGVDTCQ